MTRFWHNSAMRISASLLAVLLTGSAHAADHCAALIPTTLASRLATDLPALRLPLSTDAGATRTQELNRSGDWPCPFVVAGDFDGNGWLDRALLLPSKSAGRPRLVAVLNMAGNWQLSLSEEWPLELTDSELRPQESGFYQRTDAIAQPVAQLDQLASLQADHAAFRAGQPKGGFALYALVNAKWLKLAMPAEQ